MKIAVYNNYSNEEVVSHYLSVILLAFIKAGHDCRVIKRFCEATKTETIVVANPLDVVKLYIRGYRHFILWMQGITPEESFLKHKSKLRYHILSMVDRFALKHSKFVFLVSQAMKDFLEKKYKTTISKFYIMPCYNDTFNEKIMDVKDKYEQNVFAYVGSLSVWQCFEETLNLYKRIEDTLPNASLKIFTKEKELAIRLITAVGIRNWSVDTVKPQDVNSALRDVKYGFVLRNNCSVNNVATPTKISSYMAAGVIPIVTKALVDISLLANDNNCIIALDDLNDAKTLIKAVSSSIDQTKLYNGFKAIFSQYYSDTYHISRISELFKKYYT